MFQYRKGSLVITEQKGMELSSEPLEIHEALTLLEKENEHLLDTSQKATCVLKLYNKKQKEVFQQPLILPYEGKIEEVLSRLAQAKLSNEYSEKIEKGKWKGKAVHVRKIPIQTVTLFGFSILSICVLFSSTAIVNAINETTQQQLTISRELLLSQLESDQRYDKVAQKMKAFDYSQKEITDMYIENGKFINALKADSNTLESVLKKIDTQDAKEQKNSLETIKKADLLEKEQSLSLDLRLALLNQDTDYLSKNKKNIDSQELADSIVKYFASEKKYEEATTVLSDFPNADLGKVIAKEATDHHVKQLEDALDSAKEAVKEKQNALDAKNQQISDLGKQLDDINKNEEDKDKGTHAEEKQKEIETAKNEQENLSSELAELKKTQEQAQKSLDDSAKK